MATVSIFEGTTEHIFDVPPGYRPVVTSAGHGELVIDPDYTPKGQEVLPGLSEPEQMGQRALFAVELGPEDK